MKTLKNSMLSLGIGKKKKKKRGKRTISQAAIAEQAKIPANEDEEPAGLASLGACPLLSPLILGKGVIPVATLEVCTGKYCRRNGAYAIFRESEARLAFRLAVRNIVREVHWRKVQKRREHRRPIFIGV